MSRKPINLQAVGGKPPRQALWEAMRSRGDFALKDLQHDVRDKVSLNGIESYVKSLVKAGFVEPISSGKTEEGRHLPTIYRLTRDQGVESPRINKQGQIVTQGRGREAMWTAIKILDQFSWRDVVNHASTDHFIIKEREAADYLSYLKRAGYLLCVQDPAPGRPAVYRFNKRKNTGPRPPQIQRGKSLYDPNLDAVVWQKGASA